MGYDFEKTHELILKSAMEQFTRNGFAGASIRAICNDAGVTNGAFYAHFESKEDLFAKLVSPVVNGMNELYADESTVFSKVRSSKELVKVLGKAYDSDEVMIRYIYENKKIFILLLTSGKGTVYEDLPERIAAEETAGTIAFLKENKEFIKNTQSIDESLIRRISKVVVDTVFESFLEGRSEEETVRRTKLAAEFCITGLKQILGI